MLKGGEASYDEQVFDDYAMEQYYEVFESSEDAVLLVCVLDKEYTTYYCNTVFGDHLSSSFAKMFKDEYSAFPSIVRNNIQETGYKYSLGQDLGDAVEDFTLYLKGKDIGPLLSCGGSDSPSAEPGLLNKSSLHVVTGGVDEALKTFQEETGITLVIVVDDFENVFPKQMDIGTILAVLFCLVLLVLCIVSLVKSIRRRKGGGGDNPNTTKNTNPPSGGNTYDGDYTSW